MKLDSPINLSHPIRFTAALPASVDVCIIGGGIIGISTALCLAEQGHKVLVCEKGRVAGEQSSRNWGWIRQTGRDADELPIVMESIKLWQNMAARTGENSLLFNQSGVLYLADNETELHEFESFRQLAHSHGLNSRILSSDEVAKKIPHADRRWSGGLYTESDGRVEPWDAVPAMARAAVRAGTIIIEECAARSLVSSSSQIEGVLTELGQVKTNRVLIAGGAWSSLLARQSGIYLPQLSVKSTVARVEAPHALFTGNAADGGLAFAARQDGGYSLALNDYHDFYLGPDAFRFLRPFLPAARKKLLNSRYALSAPKGYPDAWSTKKKWAEHDSSPFERCRVLDPQADPKIVARILARLRERFPECHSAHITHAWAGMIETTPDFVPVMDSVPQMTGLYVATGFSGHGFGIGPGAGRIMADLLLGQASEHDLTRFKSGRFQDGQPLRLGPI